MWIKQSAVTCCNHLSENESIAFQQIHTKPKLKFKTICKNIPYKIFCVLWKVCHLKKYFLSEFAVITSKFLVIFSEVGFFSELEKSTTQFAVRYKFIYSTFFFCMNSFTIYTFQMKRYVDISKSSEVIVQYIPLKSRSKLNCNTWSNGSDCFPPHT